ncbi:MAG: acyltransferase [Bacteroidota bacterium]
MQQINSETKYTEWLDVVRFIATLAVITIHVVAPYLYLYGHIPNSSWSFYNAVDSLTRFAVPLFVMLSGALLLNKTMAIAEFLRKRFTRILIPFLFWSVIYSAYHFILHFHEFNTGFVYYFIDALSQGASYHLWYIYMLIGLYLTIPVLSRLITNSDDELLKYYLLIWLVGLMVSNFGFKLNKDLNIAVFTGYLGYLIIGYYITHRSIHTNRLLLFIVFIGSVFFTFYKTNLQPILHGVFNGSYYQYLSLNVVLASVTLFIIIKQHLRLSAFWMNKIKLANKYSFGIYLIHVLILDSLQYFGINGAWMNPLLGIVSTILICYFASFFLIALLSRSYVIGKLIN